MMKTFTQNLLTCVALLTLFSGSLVAQTFMVVNSPGDIAGDVEVRRAAFGDQDENATTTGDLILGDDGDTTDSNGDGLMGTTSDGCQAIINDVTGQIIVLDRGDCAFVDKANNAQASGAIALLVCNNAVGDPISMTGDAPDVTIPCFMASRTDCDVIKMSMNDGNTVNVTFEVREEQCPVTYESTVFWGDQPGQGDFSVPFDESGWSTVNLEPLDRDDVVWNRLPDNQPTLQFNFENGALMESPSFCNGTAEFSFADFAFEDNPSPTQPYVTYSAELISPIIDCTGKDFVILEYYQAYNRLNNFSRFAWSTDGGDTWTEEDIEHLTTVNEEVDIRKVVKPLPDFTNEPNCRIKFIAFGDFYYWIIDDVVLKSEEVKDIRAEPDFYATAPNFTAPYEFRDEIPFLIDLKNTGNSDLATEVLVEVIKEGDVVHTQTLDYGVIPAGADADNQAFPMTYTPDAGPGEYTIRYTAVSRDGDGDDTNNTRETSFELTDVSNETDDIVMSKLPIDYANLSNWGIVGESNRSFGNYYRFPTNKFEDGSLIELQSVDAGVTQDEEDIAMEGFLKAEVYTWVDLPPADRIVQPEERTLIGEGRLLDIQNGVSNIVLNDINDDDAAIMLDINDGDGVLVMIHMNSLNSPVTWRPRAISAPGETLNLVASVLAYDSLGIANFGSMDATGSSFADVDTRSFEESGQLTYYTPIYLGKRTSSVNNLDESIKFDVYPNPTSANINVDLTLEETVDYAIIKIMDATGKYVRGMKYSNISERNVSIDMSQYNAGLYNLIIQTPNGFNSKQFTVIK